MFPSLVAPKQVKVGYERTAPGVKLISMPVIRSFHA